MSLFLLFFSSILSPFKTYIFCITAKVLGEQVYL